MLALGRSLSRPVPTATHGSSRTPHRPGVSQASQQQQPGSCAEVHCMPRDLCQPYRAAEHLHATARLLAGAVSGEWYHLHARVTANAYQQASARHAAQCGYNPSRWTPSLHPPSPHRNPCPSPNHPLGLLPVTLDTISAPSLPSSQPLPLSQPPLRPAAVLPAPASSPSGPATAAAPGGPAGQQRSYRQPTQADAADEAEVWHPRPWQRPVSKVPGALSRPQR